MLKIARDRRIDTTMHPYPRELNAIYKHGVQYHLKELRGGGEKRMIKSLEQFGTHAPCCTYILFHIDGKEPEREELKS